MWFGCRKLVHCNSLNSHCHFIVEPLMCADYKLHCQHSPSCWLPCNRLPPQRKGGEMDPRLVQNKSRKYLGTVGDRCDTCCCGQLL